MRKFPWQTKIRYDVGAQVVLNYFGTRENWSYCRFGMLPDEFRECMEEAFGLYCMGGEL